MKGIKNFISSIFQNNSENKQAFKSCISNVNLELTNLLSHVQDKNSFNYEDFRDFTRAVDELKKVIKLQKNNDKSLAAIQEVNHLFDEFFVNLTSASEQARLLGSPILSDKVNESYRKLTAFFTSAFPE